ncbi:DUF2703 domain-containing protein [Methanoculleus sp.]|uniref:DUF2703 domain-containing protein n=1 Tax=Methanoculleus sp. TaxID=90427 RepID=UPI002FC82181
MKNELVIEWRHVARDAENVFETCKETGMPLDAVLDEIRMLLEMEGVSVRIVETVGEPETLLFNGAPIEELLEGVEVTATACASCASCGESCGDDCEDEECRTLRYNGEAYEAIPPELIGRAAAKALEID